MGIDAAPYPFPLAGAFAPESTALLVIDMQGDFCRPGGLIDRLGLPFAVLAAAIPNVARLLGAFRRAGFPVLHTRESFSADLSDAQPLRLWRGADGKRPVVGDRGPLGRHLVVGEPGWAIVPELAPHAGEPVFDKPSYGAFSTTALDAALRARGVRNLVLCGVTSDCCIRATLGEALDRGYDGLTVSDASAATSAAFHAGFMEQIATRGGVFGAVATTDAVLGALED